MDQDWLLLLDERTYRVRPISESPDGEIVEVFFLDSPDHEKMTGGDLIQSSNLKPDSFYNCSNYIIRFFSRMKSYFYNKNLY